MTTKTATKAATKPKAAKSKPGAGPDYKGQRSAPPKPSNVVPMKSFSDPSKSVNEVAGKTGGKPDPKALAADAAKSTGGTGAKTGKGKKARSISSGNLESELRKELTEYKPKTFDESSSTFTKHCRMLPGGVGLEISDKITIPEAADALNFLMGMNQTLQFSIGDLLVFTESKFGEAASQICLATGYSYKTLANAQWVCERIPKERRNVALYFAHHKAVAALTEKQQDKFLSEAVKEKISSSELEKRVKAFKEAEEAKKSGKTAATPGATPAAGTGTPTDPEAGKPAGAKTGAGLTITDNGEKPAGEAPASGTAANTAGTTPPRDTTAEQNDKALESADVVISFLRSPNFKTMRPLQKKAWENIARQINELVASK